MEALSALKPEGGCAITLGTHGSMCNALAVPFQLCTKVETVDTTEPRFLIELCAACQVMWI
ncbi:MAG: hypothetical protein ACLSWD_11490 [Clostridium sp.]